MQHALIVIFSHINPVWIYPLMHLWIAGYIIGMPKARRGMWQYWHTRLGARGMAAWWHIWRTYVDFGKAILDRFAAWGGRRVQIVYENQEILDRVLHQPNGVVVVSSHLGNQELAGYNIPMQKPMDALSYMGDTETVNQQRAELFRSMGIRIIPYQSDSSHILEMHQSLVDGHLLSVHGDRMLDGVKTMSSRILGAEAAFPEGAFRMAVIEKVPVISLFLMREGNERYRLIVKELSNGQYAADSSRAQATELLHAYCDALESIAKRYPHQWFHFYEFWG